MHRLSSMPQDSIHVDILKGNIAAAQNTPDMAIRLMALSSRPAVSAGLAVRFLA